MFFNALVLTKKGPLGKIWLAAHYRKKLSKKDIIKVNVSESVEAILESRIALSLRTSSHLLFGISYLFNKQVSYLLSDALEYAYCVPQFITERGIDMEEQLENINEINLSLASSNLTFNLTQEIGTAPDFKLVNFGQLRLQGEAAEIVFDEFGDVDILRHDSRDSVHVEEILFEDHVFLDDGFGGRLDQDPTTIFDLPGESKTQSIFEVPDESQHLEDDPINDFFGVPTQPEQCNDEVPDVMDHIPPPENLHRDAPMASPTAGPSGAAPSMEEARQPSTAGVSRNVALEDELILEPLDESYRRQKRPRVGRLIVDEIAEIATGTIRTNIREAQEPEIELAPSTRNLMIAKKTLSASALLTTPERCFSSFQLKLYQSHLQVITEIVDRDDESTIVGEVNIDEGRSSEFPEQFGNNFAEDVPMKDPPPPVVPDQEPDIVPVLEKEAVKKHARLRPDEPEVQLSQEKSGSQRRRKRLRLSQEQARRGTVHEPELLHRDSDIEFEKTQMGGDPIPEDFDFPFDSQAASDYQSTSEDGLLSQLSQALSDPISFSQLTQDYNRKKAALTFFHLLALHKQSLIKLDQEHFYDEIWISKGPNFRGSLCSF